jgi:hypothetical protein
VNEHVSRRSRDVISFRFRRSFERKFPQRHWHEPGLASGLIQLSRATLIVTLVKGPGLSRKEQSELIMERGSSVIC